MRYQVASEMRADLKRLKRDTESGRTPASSGPSTAALDSAAVAPQVAVGRQSLRRRWSLVVTSVLGTLVIGLGIAWFTTRRTAAPPAETKQRRLTGNANDNGVISAVVSPDGKYLAYGDQSGVHIELIETGETQTIPLPANLQLGGAFWWPMSWFPDGTKVLAGALDPRGLQTSLWTVSILGGAPHKLRDDAFDGSVSADGSRIAFISGQSDAGGHELWVMNAHGDEPRKVAAFDRNSTLQLATWSPDGQRIAYYKFHQATDKSEVSIESLDMKGGDPTLILSDPTLQVGFCWLRDGRVIYAKGESPPNETDSNIWQILVNTRTDRPAGKPGRLTNWAGFRVGNLTSTADGVRLAFTKQVYRSDVFVGELSGRNSPEDSTASDRRRLQ